MARLISPASYARLDVVVPACLSCGAPLAGAYCATCGQQAVDLAAPTWHVVRDAVGDAVDLDGRVLRTVRALATPGLLTLDFVRGRRAPYVGPLKLFLAMGALLSTTWVLTRGVDARFYGLTADGSAARYIDTVVRGSLAACLAIAVGSWSLTAFRRRLLDETVFALHLVAALSLLTSVTIWLGTAWKLAWGRVDRVPDALPALPFLLFVPAALVGLWYAARSIRRVHGGAWWTVVLRVLALAAIGFATVTAVLLAPGLR